jgi:hypothetical protein
MAFASLIVAVVALIVAIFGVGYSMLQTQAGDPASRRREDPG